MEDSGTSGLLERSNEASAAGPGTHRGPPAVAPASFVYAIGSVAPQFPSLAVEKEFVQATGRTDTAGRTDREVLQSVLADRSGRYLARQMCWVLTIEGLETYILVPRDPADLDLLIEAIRPHPHRTDVDVVIGVRGPNAPPEMCNGLQVPIVAVDQIYSFDRDELIREIPNSGDLPDEQFRAAAGELFDHIGQLTDNAGASDEHRAVNYLAVRYPAIYVQTAEALAKESGLTKVEVRPSRLSGARVIMDVILSYTQRRTDVVEMYFCRVDVTEEFPFLVTKLSHYYER